jgi:starch-binding outer membrane protein, SusD/RagB family
MKLYRKLALLGAMTGALGLFTGCEDVLDKRDLSGLNEQVWNDSVLTRSYIDYVYDQNLPGWGGFANLSDESYGESPYFQGTVQVNTVSDFGVKIEINNNYGKIRSINNGLVEIDKGTLGPGTRNQLKGQLYFFRAWRYFDLVRLYGGVPLVLEPQDAIGDAKESTFVTRNKTSETFAQIAKDLDLAMATLPARWDSKSDWGRVTSGTAAALKGRALLYWASPQYNPGDLTDRWQAAYDANKQAKELLVANGYGLHAKFDDMWFSEYNNPEAVFVTGYNAVTNDQQKKNNPFDNPTRPRYLGTGGGSNQPTKEMMEAFPMKDGKKIGDPASRYAYDPQLFYKNRDPRFDKTIAYNGTTWPINGNQNYRLWTYQAGGKSVEPSNPTNTGFYTRKAIDKNVAAGNASFVGTDWMEIRFAEVLLNLAESACGVNKLEEAYAELKEIRKRAGIEAGDDGLYGLQPDMSRTEMMQAILDERQVEFAFEGKRYWDLRRHKLFESVLNGKRRTGIVIGLKTGTDIPKAADFAASRDNTSLDEAYTKYFTITTKTLDTKYAIGWKPEYYFFALPQQAIDNNPRLEQTMGWNGGTFDPLQ